MSWAQDITGQRFGRLVAVKCIGSSIHKRRIWLCQCDCGNTKEVLANSMKVGRTFSCGCLSKENSSNGTHGMSHLSEYQSWLGMKNRCYNKNQRQYKDWGGRGIYVCDRWHSFENFINDMGLKPSKQHTVDRIDNDGNYEPSNCKWSTKKEQNNNRRTPSKKTPQNA